ncbi:MULTISPECIES: zinc ribbon domain-containing protein [unclassified Fusibacter]|uniref:zinc ribbon domain-containing protein n=1 Tax=unclassified Fusibacter TaxID=2624464 RepID=UPI0010117DDF|nr:MULTISPECIES: zinc ribbon domain-containing protein [unclassified Fusibacter]MCK8060236.1 zinc ribbon domain-containing protein [Fusibacter sp. A2]NPE22375.1 zinc ribbon domain-containing protein [Fusibacter sp. A1]RXV61147.1 zinc ribbon domain-containing protein [Fusibacter sp. A1]
MSNFCHKCGHEMGPGDLYCPSCKAMTNEELTPEKIAEIQKNYKTDKKGCLKFVGILLVFAIIVLGSWLTGGEEGMAATVLILVFAMLNIILFKLNQKKKKQKVKSNYYKLSLKDDLTDVDDKCPRCHSIVGDEQEFCTNCGAKLIDNTPNAEKKPLKTLSKNHICESCHEVIPADAKFCSSCGSKVEMQSVCQSCGELIEPDHRFCGGCGSKVDTKEGLA